MTLTEKLVGCRYSGSTVKSATLQEGNFNLILENNNTIIVDLEIAKLIVNLCELERLTHNFMPNLKFWF